MTSVTAGRSHVGAEDWTPGRPEFAHGYVVGDPGSAGRRVKATRVIAPAGWPDTAVDGVSLKNLEIRAASVRGLLHRARHTPRQDAYSLGSNGDTLVLTVCDGVGSLALSHEAAQHVVSRLPLLLPEHTSKAGIDWAGLFRKLSNDVVLLNAKHADAEDASASNNMATTVLAAVLTYSPELSLRADLAWVGDSEPYLLRRGNWQRLSDDQIVGQVDDVGPVEVRGTAALPSQDPIISTCLLDLLPSDLLVLLSDGIAEPLGDGTGLVGGALIDWWTQAPDPIEFAAQVAFKRKGFVDDRTAVAVWVAGL